MSQIINPSIADRTTSDSSGLRFIEPDYVLYSSPAKSTSTSARSSIGELAYQMKLPTFFDPARNAMKKVSTFKSKEIQERVITILESIRNYLVSSIERSSMENRLPQIHLTEDIDGSALIEWNFEHFRIGFTVDVDEDAMSYFYISEDRQTDSFRAETKRIDGRLQEAISSVVSYVIQNS